MGWDGVSVPITDDRGRRRSVQARVREALEALHGSVEAAYVSPRAGLIYYAWRTSDGAVRPGFAWFTLGDQTAGKPDPDRADEIDIKQMPLEESPSRWPAAVADAITQW